MTKRERLEKVALFGIGGMGTRLGGFLASKAPGFVKGNTATKVFQNISKYPGRWAAGTGAVIGGTVGALNPMGTNSEGKRVGRLRGALGGAIMGGVGARMLGGKKFFSNFGKSTSSLGNSMTNAIKPINTNNLLGSGYF